MFRRAVTLRSWILGVAGGLAVMIATSLLLFGVVELFPAMLTRLQLQRIKYFALKSQYLPDSTLVVVPRWPELAGSQVRKGDLYRPEYGIEGPEIRSAFTYRNGFRINSSAPPYDVVVIGDSYVEIGEDNASTLSEVLRREAGLSTFNLGRSWYGPFQYLELFKRYGAPLRPRIALFCFFAGNDIGDIEQYHRWRQTGAYHFYDGQLTRSFIGRYLTAISDTLDFVREEFRTWKNTREESRILAASDRASRYQVVPADFGVVRVGGADVVMAFRHWNSPRSPDELLASQPWRMLRHPPGIRAAGLSA